MLASYAMRFTARPSSRGSAVDALTVICHHRPTGPGGSRGAAADSRNPNDLVISQHDGPLDPARRIDSRIAQKPLNSTRISTRRHHSVARPPGAHCEPLLRRKPRAPERRHTRISLVEAKAADPRARREPALRRRFRDPAAAYHDASTMGDRFEAAGERHSRTVSLTCGKRDEPIGSPSVERYAGSRRDSRPEQRKLLRIIA